MREFDDKHSDIPVLTLNLPGHGGQPELKGGEEPTVTAMARSLWHTVDEAVSKAPELNTAGVVLCGHSMGGHVVIEAAIQRPSSTRGVALLASVNLRPHRALGGKNMFWLPRMLGEAMHFPAVRAFLGPLLEFIYKKGLGFPRSVDRKEICWAQRRVAHLDWDRVKRSIRELTCPTFHAFARDDKLIESECAEEMCSLLDASPRNCGPRLAWDDGGHNIQKTKAPQLADELTKWVTRM